jgi:hypothetical protein
MLNVKEGMTTLFDRIKYKKYLDPMPELNVIDPRFAHYKLKQPVNGNYKLALTQTFTYSDVSINEISYNNLSDFSLNFYHKNYGIFGISDNSLVRFVSNYSMSSRYMLYLDFSSSIPRRPNINNFNMIFKEQSGNILELATTSKRLENLSIRIKDNGATSYDDLIKDGAIEIIPPSVLTLSSEIINTTASATGGAGGAGGNITLGDTNLNLGSLRSLFSGRGSDLDNLLFSQLLQNGTYGSAYVPPVYNNFETAMNLPSNPIVNPVNSMNPVQYAESLFGPNITPVMAKNAYLNQNVESAATVESSNNAMKAITSPAPSFDTNGNLLAQNSSANVSSNRVNNNKNIATEDYPPCPAPQRCPEPNFDCKKVPKYEQGPENPFLPRPVLTDFSTFGM